MKRFHECQGALYKGSKKTVPVLNIFTYNRTTNRGALYTLKSLQRFQR